MHDELSTHLLNLKPGFIQGQWFLLRVLPRVWRIFGGLCCAICIVQSFSYPDIIWMDIWSNNIWKEHYSNQPIPLVDYLILLGCHWENHPLGCLNPMKFPMKVPWFYEIPHQHPMEFPMNILWNFPWTSHGISHEILWISGIFPWEFPISHEIPHAKNPWCSRSKAAWWSWTSVVRPARALRRRCRWRTAWTRWAVRGLSVVGPWHHGILFVVNGCEWENSGWSWDFNGFHGGFSVLSMTRPWKMGFHGDLFKDLLGYSLW